MRYGTRVRSGDIELIYKKTNTIPRFAIVVSTKIDKRATRRNRIRRIVSESLRHLLPVVVPVDGVLIVRRNITDLKQVELESFVFELFSKVHLLNHE